MSKRYTLLLFLLLGLFVIMFILLSFYSRLSSDDYYFIYDVRRTGIGGNVYSQYMEWCGRFAATFAMDVPYRLFDVDQTWYFLLPLISFILLITGVYLLCKVACLHLNYSIEPSRLLIASFSFSILLFFMSYDIGETWFWYCSLSSYLWSIIAFIWGIWFLLGTSNKYISIIFASLCFIYIGGSSEVYSVIYGVLLLIFLICRYKRTANFKRFISDNLNFRFLIIYFIFGVSFFIFLAAPGNYLRDQQFPDRHFLNSLFITLKAIIKFGVLFIPFRMVYVLTFGIPFIVIGAAAKNSGINKISFGRFFRIATIILASLILLFFILIAFVMIETGPPRLWFLLSFLLSVYTVIICFYAGYTGYIEQTKIGILKTAGLILASLIMIYCFTNQLPTALNYSKAHDERVNYLTELNKTIQKDTLIELKPLPSSGMLYSSEIKEDTTHFTNKELRLGYDLKFHVKVK
jgi:hypothetical protein